MVWYINVSILRKGCYRLTGREDDGMIYCNVDPKMSPKGPCDKDLISRLWCHWVPLRGSVHWGHALKGRLETQPFLFPLPFLGTMMQTGCLLYHVLPRCAAWSQALGHQDQVTLDYEIK